MKTFQSPYGAIYVLDRESIFARTAVALDTAAASESAFVGLTGGSTPKAFYPWAAEKLTSAVFDRVVWGASDERCVPLSSEESNFGNAARGLLDGAKVPDERRLPWAVDLPPKEAAEQFTEAVAARFGKGKAFDLCLLGMGDDCHTASLFPGSPLLEKDGRALFAAIDVPGKGWRLTVTPTGLEKSARIIITVTGAGKADALRDVITGKFDPRTRPAQLLRAHVSRTTWLVDEAAAAGLA